jgi:hypothetical protein
MRKLRRPGAVMGLFALGLEAAGVASGAITQSRTTGIKP